MKLTNREQLVVNAHAYNYGKILLSAFSENEPFEHNHILLDSLTKELALSNIIINYKYNDRVSKPFFRIYDLEIIKNNNLIISDYVNMHILVKYKLLIEDPFTKIWH